MSSRWLISALLILTLSMFLPSSSEIAVPDSFHPATNLAATPTAPTITVWSPRTLSGNITDPNLLPGSPLEIVVNVTSAPSFDSYTFNLEFHPGILQYVNSSLVGSVFWPNIGIRIISPLDTPGVVQVIIFGNSAFTGSGILVRSNFKILAVGLSLLGVTNSILRLTGTRIDHQTLGACFNNRPARSVSVDFTTDPSPGYYDTSSYMLGRVAVGVILPQSIGHVYNWTDAHVSQVLDGIKAGMDWWAAQESLAHLNFTFDYHVRVPTAYEPIEMPSGQSTVWIADVMNRMGYNGDAFSATLAYDNAIRMKYHTDWAFTVFSVENNPGLNLGRFPDNQYAWAFIGGPYTVIARYSGWASNAAQYYPAIPAHETGHIFGATDEYNGRLEYSGYLWLPDADSSYGIMNAESLKASLSTEGQIGLVACGTNGAMTLLDTQPALRIDSAPPIITQQPVTVTGKAEAVPSPTYRPGGRNITIGKIVSVQYTIDQGVPVIAVPADGAFDGALEGFSFNLTGLAVGGHTVSVTAVNSVGKTTTVSFQTSVVSTVGSAGFTGWETKPAYRHLDLDKVPSQTFLANVNVSGAPTYIYVRYSITNDTGTTYTVLSTVQLLSVGNHVVKTRWVPPHVSSRYRMTATLFYSPILLQPGSSLWTLGGVSSFTFRASTQPDQGNFNLDARPFNPGESLSGQEREMSV